MTCNFISSLFLVLFLEQSHQILLSKQAVEFLSPPCGHNCNYTQFALEEIQQSLSGMEALQYALFFIPVFAAPLEALWQFSHVHVHKHECLPDALNSWRVFPPRAVACFPGENTSRGFESVFLNRRERMNEGSLSTFFCHHLLCLNGGWDFSLKGVNNTCPKKSGTHKWKYKWREFYVVLPCKMMYSILFLFFIREAGGNWVFSLIRP